MSLNFHLSGRSKESISILNKPTSPRFTCNFLIFFIGSKIVSNNIKLEFLFDELINSQPN